MMLRKDLPDKKRLLQELDSLDYSARIKRVAALGREHLGSERYPLLLASLLEDGAYEARLALMGAIATGNAAIIIAGLHHSKASIRYTAAGLVAKVASDAEIERELPNLPHDCRRRLLRSISHTNRQELAERLLPVVHARWGADEAVIILQACYPATVSLWLPELGYAVRYWGELASRHLDAVAEYFRATLEGVPRREKGAVWGKFASAAEFLCQRKAGLVLECALEHGPVSGMHPAFKEHIGTLVRQYPGAVYELLTRMETRNDLLARGVPEGVLKRNKLFSREQWIELAKLLADQPMQLAGLLDALAPSRRQEIFDAVYEEEQRQERIFPEYLLSVLPHALRDREAARMLNLRTIREERDQALSITAYRSITRSREQLEAAAQVSNADDRATALVHLIKSTSLSRQGVKETLAFLGRIKNDQDPVRIQVLQALVNSPVSLYGDEHVPELTLLTDSVIEARDSSYSTKYILQQLAFSILRHHAGSPDSRLFKFALDTIRKLAWQSGQLPLPSLEEAVPQGTAELIFGTLYPQAVKAGQREDYNVLFSVASSLGKRGHSISRLQNLLKEAASSKLSHVASRAASLWLKPRVTRDERVRTLLSIDKSYITLHEVFQHVHRRRQDWLDPFISGTVITGRFLTGKTIYLMPAENGFHRWLPRQQQALSTLLERIAADAGRNLYERVRAIRIIASMPDGRPDKLQELLTDKVVNIVEAALHGLSLTEEPEMSLPALLDHVAGDRARVAMYSIPRCIRRVSPGLLASMLRELLQRDKLKITVRKEAIRLLAAYRNSDTLPLLLSEFAKTNVHKDVIIAIGHAARQLLDDERAWGILGSLAASANNDIAQSLLSQQPNQLPEEYRPRYLQLIIGIAGHADNIIGRQAYHSMISWTSGNEAEVAAATVRAILNLEDSTRWQAAMNTLVETCRDGKVNEAVIAVCQELAEAEVKAEWNAAQARDLPHRQRLLKLIGGLTLLPKNTRIHLKPLYMGIINSLTAHETLQQTVVKLYAAAADWNNVNEAAAYLTRVVQAISNQPQLLEDTYKQLAHSLKDSVGYWTPAALLEIVDVLGKQEGFEFQYLGLSLLEAAGTAMSWRPEAAERLRLYRNHRNIAVRSHALNIWTAAD